MPEVEYFNPSLTTVTHDFETAGRTCLEFLLRLIRDPHAPAQRLVIKPELVCRESTAKGPFGRPRWTAPAHSSIRVPRVFCSPRQRLHAKKGIHAGRVCYCGCGL